jgi:hypothetical protein
VSESAEYRARTANEEEKMFQVTEKAGEMIKDYLKDQDTLPSIRIYLNAGG